MTFVPCMSSNKRLFQKFSVELTLIWSVFYVLYYHKGSKNFPIPHINKNNFFLSLQKNVSDFPVIHIRRKNKPLANKYFLR